MTFPSIRTTPEPSGMAQPNTHDFRTDLDESGQIWTNPLISTQNLQSIAGNCPFPTQISLLHHAQSSDSAR